MALAINLASLARGIRPAAILLWRGGHPNAALMIATPAQLNPHRYVDRWQNRSLRRKERSRVQRRYIRQESRYRIFGSAAPLFTLAWKPL